MGDAGLSDEGLIIDIGNFDNPDWKITTGDALTCKCNYQYLTDNLLDPSHVAGYTAPRLRPPVPKTRQLKSPRRTPE